MKHTRLADRVSLFEFSATGFTSATVAQDVVREASAELNIGTYGGMNTDTFFESMTRNGYRVMREEICPEDDDSIGLRMPEFWPINQGEWALSIGMYYAFYQIKHLSIGDLASWNKDIRQRVGWHSVIELYDVERLTRRLRDEQMPYFTTQSTLMECVRFLEGWGITRLDAYRDHSLRIRDWAQQQEFFVAEEWNLGRATSEGFLREHGRPTNVRRCVQEYWRRVLLNQPYDPIAKEMDIVCPAFSQDRRPAIVLIGEEFLDVSTFQEHTITSGDQSLVELRRDPNLVVFPYNRYKDVVRAYPVKKTASEQKRSLTARLARDQHPDAHIAFLSFGPQTRPFTLVKSDEVKEGIGLEILLALQAATALSGRTDLTNAIAAQLV